MASRERNPQFAGRRARAAAQLRSSHRERVRGTRAQLEQRRFAAFDPAERGERAAHRDRRVDQRIIGRLVVRVARHEQFRCSRILRQRHAAPEHDFVRRACTLALGDRPLVVVAGQELAVVEVDCRAQLGDVVTARSASDRFRIDIDRRDPTERGPFRLEYGLGVAAGDTQSAADRPRRGLEARSSALLVDFRPKHLEQPFAGNGGRAMHREIRQQRAHLCGRGRRNERSAQPQLESPQCQ